ncbi:signal peptidase II [Pseudoalteromonas sp. R3]|uniref:signal peptidase II n=1 Tax=Pseudoalteromonas sp. R3 TaxID=1709477 RepID=UPI0006B5A7E0|nr:signal peptidase II [Pseudoalteromonas sp. R3]AZZ99891.1 signal peptidase II [Pseudoalteromonas sp. R3]
MTTKQRMHWVLMICVVGMCLDQLSKWFAGNYLHGWQMTSYWHDIVRIGYRENAGAFLSLGSELPAPLRSVLFIGVLALLLIAILMYTLKSEDLNRNQITGLSLVLSGGVSNLIDRILNNGAVIDFLNLGIGEVRTGVFNLADVAIMLGAVMLIVYTTHNQTIAPQKTG